MSVSQQQTCLNAGEETLCRVKTPSKVFVTHAEAHFFSRKQAFPLRQSATGTHTNNNKKCLWCRNFMQIESLLNQEYAATVTQVEFRKGQKHISSMSAGGERGTDGHCPPST